MSDPIFSRTSIRKFTDEPISDEQIEQLMKAGMAAPSAGNQQPWEFFLTRDADVKQRLSECSPYAKPAANADVALVVCQRSGDLRFAECATQDMSACVENILLEADALGLGAVWLGIYPVSERMEAVANLIECGSNLTPFALVAIGHPAESFEPRSANRFDMSRVHWI